MTSRIERSRRLLPFLLSAVWAGCAQAAHPLITEDAATQGAGRFQLELNSEFATDREAGVKTTTHQLGVLLAAGLTDALDLVIGQPRLRIASTAGETARGAGDASLDLKWRFYERGRTSFSLKPGVTLPTGDEARGLGTGKATYALFLVGSFEGEPWTMHLHTGYKANRNRLGQPVDVLHLSTAAVYQATRRVKLVADWALDTDFELSTGRQPAWLVLGAICSLGENLDLDLGARQGLNRVAPDTTLLFGLTVRW